MTAIEFTVGCGMRGKVLPGEEWHAQFYDAGDGQFYAGSGPTPWIAIQWALDERAHRRAGYGPRPAVDPRLKPTLDPPPLPPA